MGKTIIDTGIDDFIETIESNESARNKQSKRYLRARNRADRYRDGDYTKGGLQWEQEAIAAPFKEFVIPNVSGQYRVWKASLRRRSEMADRVIQMGNLLGTQDNAIDPLLKNNTVFNGNAGLVFAIIKFFSKTHAGWEQLIGVNELAAIFAPDVYLCSEKATEILAENWLDTDNGCFKVATVVDNKLVTHRGLTYLQWLEIGSPDDAETAAQRLNEKYRGATSFEDSYLNSGCPNFGADPMWADVLMETIPSWLTSRKQCPFDQIHSGQGIHTEAGRMLLNDKRSMFHFVDKNLVKMYKWGSELGINGARFMSVHTTEAERDTTLRRFERTSFLEFESQALHPY